MFGLRAWLLCILIAGRSLAGGRLHLGLLGCQYRTINLIQIPDAPPLNTSGARPHLGLSKSRPITVLTMQV
jgi:hypothetical protein